MMRKQVNTMGFAAIVSLAAGICAAPEATAEVAGIYAYPKAGQNQQQLGRDEWECREWARGQTGFDPSTPPPPAYASNYNYAPPPPPSSSGTGVMGIGSRPYAEGGILQDAGIGGALGAVGGAIAGDAGSGAAIGALASVLFGGVQRLSKQDENKQWQQQQQYAAPPPDQAQADWSNRMSGFRSAYAACMGGRNYEVR